MRIDVHFNGSSTGGQAELHDRVVLVIDVLRASTSIAAALNNGARAVIPFQGVDEAMTRARSLERSDVLLAGERKMVPIRGFDLGNSPGEFTPAVVQGKTIVMTTTNGTAALAGAQGAHEVLVGSFANYSVVVAWLRAAARADKSITLVCAGTDGRFALEDARNGERIVGDRLRGVALERRRRAGAPCPGPGKRDARLLESGGLPSPAGRRHDGRLTVGRSARRGARKSRREDRNQTPCLRGEPGDFYERTADACE